MTKPPRNRGGRGEKKKKKDSESDLSDDDPDHLRLHASPHSSSLMPFPWEIETHLQTAIALVIQSGIPCMHEEGQFIGTRMNKYEVRSI